jgi:oligopeptide/dipeptide ABC transporter ATP-binding protein
MVTSLSLDRAPLLRVRSLKRHFPVARTLREAVGRDPAEEVRALDGVDIDVGVAETVAVVGESGSGKTTLARCILLLDTPTDGEIEFDGRDLRGLEPREMRLVRRNIQAVFQDPASSLNPRQRVWEIISHPLRTHRVVRGKDARMVAARELLEFVELRPEDGSRFPHQFSLGQRQRIAIARAIALRPKLIIADEPVSALDVSVQAQILNLLDRLQRDLGVSYLFISHDLRVVRHLASRVYVMYGGRVVESAEADKLFEHPVHPYTRALLASVPVMGMPAVVPIAGEPVNPRKLPTGCRFQARCPLVEDECRREEPALERVGGNRRVRCIKADALLRSRSGADGHAAERALT